MQLDSVVLQCPTCGGVLLQGEDDKHICKFCGNTVLTNREVKGKIDTSKIKDDLLSKIVEDIDFENIIKNVKGFRPHEVEIEPLDFLDKMKIDKPTLKACQSKSLNQVKLDGYIQKVQYNYNAQSDVCSGLDVELKKLLDNIEEIDKDNVYLLFLRHFVLEIKPDKQVLKDILFTQEAIDAYKFIVPFAFVKKVIDNDIARIFVTYITLTNESDDLKAKAILKLLEGVKDKSYEDIKEFIFALNSLQVQDNIYEELVQFALANCIDKNTNIELVFALCQAINTSKLSKMVKNNLFEDVCLCYSLRFKNVNELISYIAFIEKCDIDNVIKFRIIRSCFEYYDKYTPSGQAHIVFEKGKVLANILHYIYLLKCFEGFGKQIYEIVKFIITHCVQESMTLQDKMSIIDFVLSLPFSSIKKNEYMQFAKEIVLSNITNCDSVTDMLNIIEYVTRMFVFKGRDDELLKIIQILFDKIGLLENVNDCVHICEYIEFNRLIKNNQRLKFELLKKLFKRNVKPLSTFNDCIMTLEAIGDLKMSALNKTIISNAFIKHALPENLSIEGYITLAQYLTDDVKRFNYLLCVFLSYGEELFFNLKSILYLNVINKDELLLAVKLCKRYSKENVVSRNRILDDLEEIVNENKLSNKFSRNIRKSCKNELKFITLLCNGAKGKKKQEFVNEKLNNILEQAKCYNIDIARKSIKKLIPIE